MEAPGVPPDASAIADRLAIADVVHAYALHVRNGEGARCADLFVEDAVYEIAGLDPDGPSPKVHKRLEGREAIATYIAGSSTGASRVLPMIHNLLVALDGEDASASAVNMGVTVPGGGALYGEYHDTLRRTDGRWRFTARRFTLWLTRPGPP